MVSMWQLIISKLITTVWYLRSHLSIVKFKTSLFCKRNIDFNLSTKTCCFIRIWESKQVDLTILAFYGLNFKHLTQNKK